MVEKTDAMPYKGQTILEHLEALEPADVYERGQARFPVNMIRPKTEEYHDFRGYAGKLYGNNIKVGCSYRITSLTESLKVSNIQFLINNLMSVGSSITIRK
jgi:sulfate adenylyltransferase subunit 1